MIEYFTALVLSYTLHNHEINTVVWFESERHCMKAMSSRTFDHMYDHMYELYGNDISMWCLPSDVQSKLVRPRVRPN
jgi:hypothetical protein